MKKNTQYIVWAAVLLVILGLTAWWVTALNTPGKYDTFAQCLKDKGATFYGAFWCPHCKNQKAMFGRSAKYLPYNECSTPDGQEQLQACTDAGVKQYPTWTFADGSVEAGEVALTKLAEKTGCTLPQ